MRKKTAFTLIELLVVVSIIALLVSILLPALGRARQQARQVVCMTKLKQIATGFHMYAADNQDYFPPSTWTDYNAATTDKARYWYHLLFQYCGGFTTENKKNDWQNLWRPEPDSFWACPEQKEEENGYLLRSFGYNSKAVPQPGEPDYVASRVYRSYDLVNRVLVIEYGGYALPPYNHLLIAGHGTGGPPESVARRHMLRSKQQGYRLTGVDMYQGSANYMYSDGHVESSTEDPTVPGAVEGLWGDY